MQHGATRPDVVGRCALPIRSPSAEIHHCHTDSENAIQTERTDEHLQRWDEQNTTKNDAMAKESTALRRSGSSMLRHRTSHSWGVATT